MDGWVIGENLTRRLDIGKCATSVCAHAQHLEVLLSGEDEAPLSDMSTSTATYYVKCGVKLTEVRRNAADTSPSVGADEAVER